MTDNLLERKHDPAWELLPNAGSASLALSGKWTLDYFESLSAKLQKGVRQQIPKRVRLVGAELIALDTAGAMAIWRLLGREAGAGEELELDLSGLSAEQQELLRIVWERLENFQSEGTQSRRESLGFLQQLGKRALPALNYIHGMLSFLGELSSAFLAALRKPALFRPKELFVQLEDVAVRSIPVVMLVTFLIGIVVAYLMAMQVEKYGAQILVVNGVALAMCRELSPIIVAIIMAGRSGSAYTAQLGTMRLNEEIDALTALGLSPLHVLALPRILALVIAMPLLVFLGDMIGILGGMLISYTYVDITPSTFIERLRIALPMRSLWVGLIKAPVFAFVIGVIGCRKGFTVEKNARSVGLSTTATVVESIVLVILLNATFAVIFANVGM